jgi:NAD(P)-dependent dehydrogenase (short-subunit alcohol dehydrogenase family)
MDYFKQLQGQNALVTGASRGIGKAIAKGLAAAGVRVAITGRSAETLEPVAEELRSIGTEVLAVPCHNGREEDREHLAQTLLKDWGGIDILVNNAATNPVMTPLAETSLEAWDKIQAINVTGPLALIQKLVPAMIARGGGSIINVTSVAGLEPAPGLGAYSVSKAAVIMMTKVLARELGGKGVRVNAIAPGLIETKFSEALFQSKTHYDHFIKSVPMGRHGQPEEIVGAALYLASHASSYMTGQVLVIDG